MIKEIIVVEGKDDTTAIQRAVKADTIETGGSAINKVILQEIALAHSRRGVIVFTDPDHAGERIRKLITEHVPGCKHAFLSREEAAGKKGIGIEYASSEAIRQALERVRTEYEDLPPLVSWADYMSAGLIHHEDAARNRLDIGQILGIGYANGKQFYKRIKMYQISAEEFTAACLLYRQRRNLDE